jgi:hypothetical protein
MPESRMNRIVLLGLYLFLKGARGTPVVTSTKWRATCGKVVSSETTRDVSTYRRSSIVTFAFFWLVPVLGKPVGS